VRGDLKQEEWQLSTATDEASLRRKFRVLAAKCHPDSSDAEDAVERFQALSAEYERRLRECRSAGQRAQLQAQWLNAFGPFLAVTGMTIVGSDPIFAALAAAVLGGMTLATDGAIWSAAPDRSNSTRAARRRQAQAAVLLRAALAQLMPDADRVTRKLLGMGGAQSSDARTAFEAALREGDEARARLLSKEAQAASAAAQTAGSKGSAAWAKDARAVAGAAADVGAAFASAGSSAFQSLFGGLSTAARGAYALNAQQAARREEERRRVAAEAAAAAAAEVARRGRLYWLRREGLAARQAREEASRAADAYFAARAAAIREQRLARMRAQGSEAIARRAEACAASREWLLLHRSRVAAEADIEAEQAAQAAEAVEVARTAAAEAATQAAAEAALVRAAAKERARAEAAGGAAHAVAAAAAARAAAVRQAHIAAVELKALFSGEAAAARAAALAAERAATAGEASLAAAERAAARASAMEEEI
jgi:hypothetical protein